MQHNYSLAFVAGLKRATDEGSLPEIAQYSPYYLPLNVFTASKGSNLYILFMKPEDMVMAVQFMKITNAAATGVVVVCSSSSNEKTYRDHAVKA